MGGELVVAAAPAPAMVRQLLSDVLGGTFPSIALHSGYAIDVSSPALLLNPSSAPASP